MDDDLGFVHDEFSRGHLREWFRAGRAPYGWDFDDLLAFEGWVIENGPHLYAVGSWLEMARTFERGLAHE